MENKRMNKLIYSIWLSKQLSNDLESALNSRRLFEIGQIVHNAFENGDFEKR